MAVEFSPKEVETILESLENKRKQAGMAGDIDIYRAATVEERSLTSPEASSIGSMYALNWH